MRALWALLGVSGCVFATSKDDDSGTADQGPADGRWVGSCAGVVSGGGGGTIGTDTGVTGPAPSPSTSTGYLITFDPAILTLQDQGGALDGTFAYTLVPEGYQGVPWIVEGTHTGSDVLLTLTGFVVTGTTTFTLSVPVTFDLVLAGDSMTGTLVIDYSATYFGLGATPASSTTPSYDTGGGRPAAYFPCTFTRQ